mgnify:CR=1 FL=1
MTAMDTATTGPDRLLRARRIALKVGLPLLAGVMLGSAVLVYRQPVPQVAQWLAYLITGLTCLALIPPSRRAIRLQQRDRLEWLGLVLLVLMSAMLLVRIAALLFVIAVQDPGMNLFRPVFAFVPCIFLGAMMLLPSRRAIKSGWLLYAIVMTLLIAAIFINGWTLDRSGLPELLLWMIFGNPLFMLVVHAIPGLEDALDQSAAEVSELRERSQLLDRVTANEQRFNLVADSLQVGVWDQRFEDGVLVERWWSSRYYELLGYTPEELPPTAESMARLLGDGDADRIREQLYDQLRADNDGVTATDARMLTKDRGWRWFNIACKGQFDADGKIVRITGAIEDIHLRRVAEIELRAAQEELIALAYRDALTNLPNRRAFDDQLQREWERARRSGKPLSLLSLDLDWFKGYNDYYGHPAGDECLRQIARIISESVRRPGDFSGRVGGEEFLVLMPETDAAGAMKVARLMEDTLRERALPHHDSPLDVVTFSIGITTEMVTAQSQLDALLARADQNLYESKRSGRNRITAT